jgi:phenylacetate-CoA ligase
MLVVRGINVYPSQVEAALVGIPQLSPHYQIVVTRERTLDELEVRIEVDPSFHQSLRTADSPELESLRRRAEQALYGVLNLHVKVTLAAPGSLPRSEGGKLRRVVDQRKL